MKKLFFALVFGALSLYAKPTVTVSIVPQKYFVQKIAGDTINVNIMVKPGNSPATYEPKPKQMVSLDKSGAYFAIGVPYERTWLPKFSKTYPNLPIVLTQEGIKLREMKGHKHNDEEHGHDNHKEEHAHDDHKDKHDSHKEEHVHHDHEEHEQKTMDPHVWLDPIHVKTMSQNITKALSRIYPENKALYEANFKKFSKELDSLHKKIQEKLSNATRKKFMVFHPSWGYFADRYGLEQEAIEIEGKEPKPAALTKLIKEAKVEDIHLIIVQPQFSQKSAKIIAREIDGKVTSLNQLSLDWDKEMLRTADLLAQTLK